MSARLEPVPGTWQRVSPKQIAVELVGALGAAVVSGGLAVATWFAGLGIPSLLLAVTAVVSLIVAALVPRRVRSYGYLLRDDDLLFRRGLLIQRFVAIPYGRMQLIDITRGPVARALGLSELKFVTAAAATAVTIPGLPEEAADALRDRLVALAETRRVGL